MRTGENNEKVRKLAVAKQLGKMKKRSKEVMKTEKANSKF